MEPIRIDCTVDFELDVAVEKKALATGALGAYAGVAPVTWYISATRDGAAIDPAYGGIALERSGVPGQIWLGLDVTVLQGLLATHEGQHVWILMNKDGVMVGHPLRALVARGS
jgi:hypothetical protein